MRLLGIETSCDETAAAIVEFVHGRFCIRSSVVYSQVKKHAKTGGVVPEVAAREHCVKIAPVIEKAFRDVKIRTGDIDAIAVTAGPGLLTALLVGVEAARTLAIVFRKPVIPINHIEAHAVSSWLNNRTVAFPAICLVVSGGHTELLLMKRRDSFRCVGRTLDDAAGEAFDKVAKLLKRGYPGGLAISRAAIRGDSGRYALPRPMMHTRSFDFSFAGIKTAVSYQSLGFPGKPVRTPVSAPDMAASFQQAVVDVLVHKTVAAAQRYRCASVLLAGGVAANVNLRRQLAAAVARQLPNATYHQPALEFCTDNAAMIAVRGAFAYAKKRRWPWQRLKADPNWETWSPRSGQ
jgi:N6-L-threonylcarbamoyladenine synthase